MGCGCLGRNKVEILSKIKEVNLNYGIPIIINTHLEDSFSNNKRNHNNNNVNNVENTNNSYEIVPIQINTIQNIPKVINNNNVINSPNLNINNNALINNIEDNLSEIPEEHNISFNHSYVPYLQPNQDENFNYKEVDNVYIGVGVKRMNGYISPVSYEELVNIREQFWNSRIEGNKMVWEILHMICNDNSLSMDDMDNLLNSNNIVTYKGCINVTYDNKGYLYEIPNYCINDPIQYEKYEQEIKQIPEN